MLVKEGDYCCKPVGVWSAMLRHAVGQLHILIRPTPRRHGSLLCSSSCAWRTGYWPSPPCKHVSESAQHPRSAFPLPGALCHGHLLPCPGVHVHALPWKQLHKIYLRALFVYAVLKECSPCARDNRGSQDNQLLQLTSCVHELLALKKGTWAMFETFRYDLDAQQWVSTQRISYGTKSVCTLRLLKQVHLEHFAEHGHYNSM